MYKVTIKTDNIIGKVENAVRAIAFSNYAIWIKTRKNYGNGTATVTFLVDMPHFESVMLDISEAMKTRVELISCRRTLRSFLK